MIVIRMSGGLGNQMFQYALFIKLQAMGRQVCFDDWSEYEHQAETGVRRPIRLSAFGIQYPRAEKESVRDLTDARMDVKSRIRRKLQGRHSLEKHDRDLVFDPSFLEQEEGYFCGCFQSEKYFADVREKVKEAFTFPESLWQEEPERAALAARMQREDSVAVHLRFGDYLDKADTYGGICTPAYYEEAVRQMRERLGEQVHFYVFSNDEKKAADWIAAMEKKEKETADTGNAEEESGREIDSDSRKSKNRRSGTVSYTLIKGADEDHGYLDLALMTKCRHHIIANSSFSWWGAWLADHPGQLIMAPSLWIHMPDGSTLARRDIFTEKMFRINGAGELVFAPDAPAENARDARDAGDTGDARGAEYARDARECRAQVYRPLVSVIVAAYNVADYLPRAFASLKQQTYENLEILVVDDGSTDGRTPALCDAFAAKDSRVQVIHKKNGGLSDARNAGLERAKGAYIAFLDGDDWYEPAMIEAMVAGCLQGNAQIAVVRYEQVRDGVAETASETAPETGQRTASEITLNTAQETIAESAQEKTPEISFKDGDETKKRKTGFIDAVLDQSVLLNQQQALRIYTSGDDRVIIYNSVWSKLFKRSCIEDLRFPTGRNSEDIIFTAKAFTAMERLVYLDVPLYNYVLDRAGSIMNEKAGERRFRDELPFWREQIAWFASCGMEEIAKRAAFYFYRRLLFYDLEFRADPSMMSYAKRLETEVLAEKDRVLMLLKEPFASRGDRVRMRLFLASPALYAKVSGLYENTVVKWKNR